MHSSAHNRIQKSIDSVGSVFFFKVYLFILERERAQRGEAEGEEENLMQTPCCLRSLTRDSIS